jgi:hypothetical protein
VSGSLASPARHRSSAHGTGDAPRSCEEAAMVDVVGCDRRAGLARWLARSRSSRRPRTEGGPWPPSLAPPGKRGTGRAGRPGPTGTRRGPARTPVGSSRRRALAGSTSPRPPRIRRWARMGPDGPGPLDPHLHAAARHSSGPAGTPNAPLPFGLQMLDTDEQVLLRAGQDHDPTRYWTVHEPPRSAVNRHLPAVNLQLPGPPKRVPDPEPERCSPDRSTCGSKRRAASGHRPSTRLYRACIAPRPARAIQLLGLPTDR